MKRIYWGILVILISACQQDKTGFVNNVTLMDGYKEKIAVEESYAEKRNAFIQKKDSISRAFQMEAQAVEARVQSMSQSKQQEAFNELQQKGQRIGQQLQQEEQQLQSMAQADMDSVVQKVKKEIIAYGKANGYTFILGGGEGGSVLFGAESKDLTEEILKVLNAEVNKSDD